MAHKKVSTKINTKVHKRFKTIEVANDIKGGIDQAMAHVLDVYDQAMKAKAQAKDT